MQATEHEKEMARDAIDRIGAVAAPFLVKWIQYNPGKGTQLQRKFADFLCKTRYRFTARMGQSAYYPKGELLASGATEAFKILGTRAVPQLDDLCRVLNDLKAPIDPRTGMSSADRAAYCLSCLGTIALPALTEVIQNPQRQRWVALNCIWLIELHCRIAMFPNPEIVDDLGDATDESNALFPISAVIDCLGDTNDPNVSRKAAQILTDLKVAPDFYLPALIAGLQSRSHFTRANSAEAIGRLGERAISAIGPLTNALADPVPTVRINVAHALYTIAPMTYPLPPSPPMIY